MVFTKPSIQRYLPENYQEESCRRSKHLCKRISNDDFHVTYRKITRRNLAEGPNTFVNGSQMTTSSRNGVHETFHSALPTAKLPGRNLAEGPNSSVNVSQMTTSSRNGVHETFHSALPTGKLPGGIL
ncbi:hypothetical protein TNCV_1621051 [Trichonephila clavipes]|nr:hypothetical protein TNCV_1621051 [Trichonephila clavipes]